MADYQKYIGALRKCAKEHENDRTSTGQIIVSNLCEVIADLLEDLSSSENSNKSKIPTGSTTKKVINIAKEFAEEMMKKFTFEEVARLFYSNSCSFCPKQHKCMGVDSVKECVNAIREKYEVDYGKEVEDDTKG